jgi:hypothetical protein
MKLKAQYDGIVVNYRHPKLGNRSLKVSLTDSSNYNELLDNGFYHLFEEMVFEPQIINPEENINVEIDLDSRRRGKKRTKKD